MSSRRRPPPARAMRGGRGGRSLTLRVRISLARKEVSGAAPAGGPAMSRPAARRCSRAAAHPSALRRRRADSERLPLLSRSESL